MQTLLPEFFPLIHEFYCHHRRHQEKGALLDTYEQKYKFTHETWFACYGAVVDNQGSIFCSDQKNHVIHVFHCSGTHIKTLFRKGTHPGELAYPCGMVFDIDGNLLVVEQGNHRVQVFDRQFQHKSLIGAAGASIFVPDSMRDDTSQTVLRFPTGIALDNAGNVLVCDTSNDRLQVFRPSGDWLRSISTTPSGRELEPLGVAVNHIGNIFIADKRSHSILIFDQELNFINQISAIEPDEHMAPSGVLIDKNGNILVVEQHHGRIQMYGPNGEIIGKIGPEQDRKKQGLGRLQTSWIPITACLDKNGTLFVVEGGSYSNPAVIVYG